MGVYRSDLGSRPHRGRHGVAVPEGRHRPYLREGCAHRHRWDCGAEAHHCQRDRGAPACRQRLGSTPSWHGTATISDSTRTRSGSEAFTFADYNLDPVFDQDITDRSEAEGTAVSFSATGTDPLGEGLTYSATGLPPGVTYGATTGLVSGTVDYTAAAGSPYLVVLTVTDPHGSTDTDTFTWTVTNVNRPPVLNDHQDRTDAEGAVISLRPRRGRPRRGLDHLVGHGPAARARHRPRHRGDLGDDLLRRFSGVPYAITVRVTDDGTPVLWVEDTFQWTVTDTNRAPVVTNPGDQTVPKATRCPWRSSDRIPMATRSPGRPRICQPVWHSTLEPASSPGRSLRGVGESPYSVLVQIFDDGTPVTRTEVMRYSDGHRHQPGSGGDQPGRSQQRPRVIRLPSV